LLHSFRSCESIGGSHLALLLPDLADEIPAAPCYSKETRSPHVADHGARHVHPMGWMCLFDIPTVIINTPFPFHRVPANFLIDVFYTERSLSLHDVTHSSSLPYTYIHPILPLLSITFSAYSIPLWTLVVVRNVDAYDG